MQSARIAAVHSRCAHDAFSSRGRAFAYEEGYASITRGRQRNVSFRAVVVSADVEWFLHLPEKRGNRTLPI